MSKLAYLGWREKMRSNRSLSRSLLSLVHALLSWCSVLLLPLKSSHINRSIRLQLWIDRRGTLDYSSKVDIYQFI